MLGTSMLKNHVAPLNRAMPPQHLSQLREAAAHAEQQGCDAGKKRRSAAKYSAHLVEVATTDMIMPDLPQKKNSVRLHRK